MCAQSMYEIFTSNASLMCIYLIQRKKEEKGEEEEDTSTGKWCSLGAAPAHEVTIWKHGLGAAGQLDTAGLLHRKLGNPEGYELDMHG